MVARCPSEEPIAVRWATAADRRLRPGPRHRSLEDYRLFAALGRFTVRFRWLIIAGWIVATVVLAFALPSLTSVEKSSNSDFLPATEPSVRAQASWPRRSSRRPSGHHLRGRHHAGGVLTAADQAAIDARRAGHARRPPGDRGARPGGVDQRPGPPGAGRGARSPSTPTGTRRPTQAVAALRSTFATSRRTARPGHAPDRRAWPASVDEQNQNGHIQTLIELLSVLFIVALLFLTFRALLAPFIALLPSAVALVAAGPIIAESTHLGVQVSDLTPILLIVVLLGAGTDYGLFLIFRLREELRRGKDVDDAVAFSLCKVGESITFSGLTVIGALATVVVATFGLYKGLGPALAIGIAVALLANLTLLPALLAVLGRSVFWPRIPTVGRHKGGTWGRIAGKVVGRPVLTLVIGLVIFGGLALSMLAYTPNGFNDSARRRPPPTRGGARPCWPPTSRRSRPIRPPCCSSCRRRCGPTRPCWPRPNRAWSGPGSSRR